MGSVEQGPQAGVLVSQSNAPQKIKQVIWAGVKEAARETIGQPKPTRVRGGKRDGRRRAGMTGALDIYDQPSREEELPDIPRMATNPALHGGMVTSIPSRYLRDVRQRQHRKDTLFHFTPAAAAHADFLMKSQGPEAMNQYLKQMKESSNMDHSKMAEDVHKSREEKEHKVGGGIEAEIERLKERAKYCREQMETFEKEADNLDAAVLKMEDAMGLLGGHGVSKARAKSPHPPRGEWERRWKQHASTPISMPDLRNEIMETYGIVRATAYQAIRSAVQAGKLSESNGLLQCMEKAEE